MKIYATHRNTHRREYRVNGLTRDGANRQTFPFERDGSTIQMTVKNYFEEELNYSLTYNHVHFYFEILFLFDLRCLFDVLVQVTSRKTLWLETSFCRSASIFTLLPEHTYFWLLFSFSFKV